MASDSTRARLWTWGRIAIRPESWPVEYLFLVGVAAIYKILVGREPPMTVFSWVWATVWGVMTNPVALALLVPFSVLLFVRGVRRIEEQNRTMSETVATQTRAAVDHDNETRRAIVGEVNASVQTALETIQRDVRSARESAIIMGRATIRAHQLAMAKPRYDRAQDAISKLSERLVGMEDQITPEDHLECWRLAQAAREDVLAGFRAFNRSEQIMMGGPANAESLERLQGLLKKVMHFHTSLHALVQEAESEYERRMGELESLTNDQ